MTPGPWKLFVVGNQWAVVPINKSGKPRNGRDTEDICSGSIYRDGWKEDAEAIVKLGVEGKEPAHAS